MQRKYREDDLSVHISNHERGSMEETEESSSQPHHGGVAGPRGGEAKTHWDGDKKNGARSSRRVLNPRRGT